MSVPALPPEIRCCLFDLDGVLTDTASLHARAWQRTFDAFLRATSRRTGAPFRPFGRDDYARFVDGRSREDGVVAFLASRGIPARPPVRQRLAQRKDEAFAALVRSEGIAPFAGSVRFVSAARTAGLRCGVVSASRNCRAELAQAGIAQLFDARVDGVVAAREGLAGKPAPDTFLACARTLGVAPGAAAVFEDALAGVEAGRAGGFGYVVGVDRGERGEALRRHGADVVVQDLGELLDQAGSRSVPPGASRTSRPKCRIRRPPPSSSA